MSRPRLDSSSRNPLSRTLSRRAHPSVLLEIRAKSPSSPPTPKRYRRVQRYMGGGTETRVGVPDVGHPIIVSPLLPGNLSSVSHRNERGVRRQCHSSTARPDDLLPLNTGSTRDRGRCRPLTVGVLPRVGFGHFRGWTSAYLVCLR